MEKDNVSAAAQKTASGRSGTNRVIIVQAAVCAFFIVLTLLAGKFSPETFGFLRDEYREIMASGVSAEDVAGAVNRAAQRVAQAEIFPEASQTGEEDDTAEKADEDKDKSGDTSKTGNDAVAVMASLGNNREITVPVHGRISSNYGYRTNPISGAYALHTGVDIAADKGTPIVAAYNGVVEDTGVGAKSGNYVRMLHADGSETLYCHCSEIAADEGAVIRAGEIIAFVGSTGWSTGPHLHFEIHKNGNSIDPLTVIEESGGRV